MEVMIEGESSVVRVLVKILIDGTLTWILVSMS